MRPEYWDSYRQHIVDTLTDFGAAQQLVAIANGAAVGTTLYCPPGSAFADVVARVADRALGRGCEVAVEVGGAGTDPAEIAVITGTATILTDAVAAEHARAARRVFGRLDKNTAS